MLVPVVTYAATLTKRASPVTSADPVQVAAADPVQVAVDDKTSFHRQLVVCGMPLSLAVRHGIREVEFGPGVATVQRIDGRKLAVQHGHTVTDHTGTARWLCASLLTEFWQSKYTRNDIPASNDVMKGTLARRVSKIVTKCRDITVCIENMTERLMGALCYLGYAAISEEKMPGVSRIHNGWIVYIEEATRRDFSIVWIRMVISSTYVPSWVTQEEQ